MDSFSVSYGKQMLTAERQTSSVGEEETTSSVLRLSHCGCVEGWWECKIHSYPPYMRSLGVRSEPPFLKKRIVKDILASSAVSCGLYT